MRSPVVLVVARAPVEGEAKTRLAAGVGAPAAAELAAAALLDTLDAAVEAAARLGSEPAVVALTGDPARGARPREVQQALGRCRVVPQRGTGLAQRLVAAHLDAAAPPPGPGGPGRSGTAAVLQVGTDTPQAGADLLVRCAHLLQGGADAVLGDAEDGGWWLLGVRRASSAGVLRAVPMSTAHTGTATRAALRAHGCDPEPAPVLRDVDTADDARAVAHLAPWTRFAAAHRELAGLVRA